MGAGLHRGPRPARAGSLSGTDPVGGTGDEVEAELWRALEVARGQDARLLELRAAASLLRRRLDSGDEARLRRARAQLEAVAGALPEGRDTPDLREALDLLARG